MARLNDVPIASETLESLKRRFVRQNREIARANSIQSLRIRNLESEAARLLAENCSLREEITSLQAKLEKFQPNKTIDDEVIDLKCRLEGKLKEMSDLVVDLGQIPKRRGILTKDARLLNENGQAAADLFHQKKLDRENLSNDLAGLPVIDEDFDHDGLVQNSPAKHDIDASIETDNSLPTHLSSIEPQKDEILDANGFDDTPLEMRTDGALQPIPKPGKYMTTISTCEGDRIERESEVTEEQASRQIANSPLELATPKPEIIATDENDNILVTHTDGVIASKPVNKKRNSRASTSRKRNALKPKSTNATIQPLTSNASGSDVAEPLKPALAAVPPKLTVDGSSPHKPHTIPSIKEEGNLVPGEATMMVHERMQVFGSDNCHTPPPQMSAAVSSLTVSSRPSRRSRPAVSYAEPNLRAKMRRPTKELVGAVEGERVIRRISAGLFDESMDSQIPMNNTLHEENSTGIRRADEDPINSSVKRTDGGSMPAPIDNRACKKRKTSVTMEPESLDSPLIGGQHLPLRAPHDDTFSQDNIEDNGTHDNNSQSESNSQVTQTPGEMEQGVSRATRRHSTNSGLRKTSRRSARSSSRFVEESDIPSPPEVLEDIDTVAKQQNTSLESKTDRRVGTRRRSMMV